MSQRAPATAPDRSSIPEPEPASAPALTCAPAPTPAPERAIDPVLEQDRSSVSAVEGPVISAASDLPDARLVADALAGEPTAHRKLYYRHRPAVDRAVRAFAALDRDDAEDVIQEAFVRAFANLAKLSQPDRFGPWLLAIARNRALSRIAGRRARDRLSEEISREEALSTEVATVPALEGGNEAEVEVVRRLVAELPDGPEKEAVHLFYVEGKLSAREIAKRQGVGKSAVTMRLARFRTRVKKTLLAEVARLRGRGS